MLGQQAALEKKEPQGIIPFVTEVARYFMDFLETDFHKVRNPKRHIQNRNKDNLQVSINLNKSAMVVLKILLTNSTLTGINSFVRKALT